MIGKTMSDDNDWDKVNVEDVVKQDTSDESESSPPKDTDTDTDTDEVKEKETEKEKEPSSEHFSEADEKSSQLAPAADNENGIANPESMDLGNPSLRTVELADVPTTTTTAAAAAAAKPTTISNKDKDTISIVNATEAKPEPLQIVSIGTETNQYAFEYHQEALDQVLNQIPSPSTTKVSVVSVVGAFRTGKSFLLSWFLNYLNRCEELQKAVNADGDEQSWLVEVEEKWYESIQSIQNSGFDWRGGSDRNTTGIWMWSRPFLVPAPNSNNKDEKIAILLVDTQGMFDHETTVGLTAAIFGLSTLLSSYQIYNVDKRIQEDNLQQLALFSEYGRMALKDDGTAEKKDDEDGAKRKPFQKMEFLVRDWQHFDDDDDIAACEESMDKYLEDVLAERDASDLKDTREQITSCFESISCYLLTHPGFAVTKKKYTGVVSEVDPTFLSFLDRYCRKVFHSGMLQPKSIHGRELTAAEMSAYIKNYAEMFASGAHFPEAATMLEATTTANNTNATNLAVLKYKERMDQIAGVRCVDYMPPSELERSHRDLMEDCKEMFHSIANFGNSTAIENARDKMERSIMEDFELYMKLNESRNPLAGFETYIIPLVIGFLSIILRKFADMTCSSWSQTCRVGSDALSHVYQVVFFFILIVSSTKMKQLSQAAKRWKKAVEIMIGADEQQAK